MSQSVLANWTSGKFVFQITQNDLSLIIKKRTDLESMTDKELSAKSLRGDYNPKMEEDLSTWVLQCQTKECYLIREIIEIKVRYFLDALAYLRTISSSPCVVATLPTAQQVTHHQDLW